jgi:hypothetical protein
VSFRHLGVHLRWIWVHLRALLPDIASHSPLSISCRIRLLVFANGVIDVTAAEPAERDLT